MRATFAHGKAPGGVAAARGPARCGFYRPRCVVGLVCAAPIWCGLPPFGVPRIAFGVRCRLFGVARIAFGVVDWGTVGRFPGLLFLRTTPNKNGSTPNGGQAHQTRIREHQTQAGHTKREAGHANVVAGEGLTRIACRGRAAYRGQFPYRPCLPGPAVHPPRLREALAALPRLAALLAQGVVAALELIERKGVQLGWVDLAVLGEHGLVG